jgi:hypothetical protein
MSKNILPLKPNNIDAITEYEDKKPELLANSFQNLIMESRLDIFKRDEFKQIISVIDEEKGINISTQFNMLPFDENTKRTLDIILAHSKENGCKYPDGTFPMEYFMSMSRFKSGREAVTALNQAFNILQHTIVYIKSKKTQKAWSNIFNRDVKLFKTLSIVKSEGKKLCHYEFYEDCFDIIKDWHPGVPVSIKLLKLGLKYNPAYYLGRRLFNHAKMNATAKNHNFISVKSALEAMPILPRENDPDIYNLKKQIQIPFEKSLEKLEKEGILTSNYTFYNKKREPLTQTQLRSMNFKSFKNLYLEFELADYEQQHQKNITHKLKTSEKQLILDADKKALNKKYKKLSTRVRKIEKKVS